MNDISGNKYPKDVTLTLTLPINYGPLMAKIRMYLDRWSLIPYLGLIQRVEAIKIIFISDNTCRPRKYYVSKKLTNCF